jgi:hypothetical protein
MGKQAVGERGRKLTAYRVGRGVVVGPRPQYSGFLWCLLCGFSSSEGDARLVC